MGAGGRPTLTPMPVTPPHRSRICFSVPVSARFPPDALVQPDTRESLNQPIQPVSHFQPPPPPRQSPSPGTPRWSPSPELVLGRREGLVQHTSESRPSLAPRFPVCGTRMNPDSAACVSLRPSTGRVPLSRCRLNPGPHTESESQAAGPSGDPAIGRACH
jgi:hypothetical protein